MSKHRYWLLVIILIALALRLQNLTYHSLWFDEAVSVHWARQSIPRILEVGFTLVEDRLPPLYYLLLNGWANLFGFSESSVRGLSVVFGLLLTPVTAAIARQLFNRRVALMSAGLVALNPFLIWYSQEARMYAPTVFFGTFSIWAFLQFCQLMPRTPKPALFILLFIVTAAAGLYSHLYAGFLLPALGLWLIVSFPRRWQLWLIFAAGGLLITLAYAPILLAIWRFSAEATPGDPLNGLAGRAWWLLQAFTIWKAPLTPALNIIIPAAILLFTGLAYLPLTSYRLPINTPPHPLLLTTLLCFSPFLIATLLLTRNHLAFFGERYFIVMVPWLLMLAAAGADKLRHLMRRQMWKWQKTGNTQHASPFPPHSSLPLLPFALLLTLAALPLPGQWSLPAAKEAWRQSVNYLAQRATADDAILIHPDWVRYPFQYYFQGPGQTYAAFSNVTPDTPLDGPLHGVVANHNVLWLVQSHLEGPDPSRLVEQWLAARYPLVTELYPPGVTVKGYALNYQLDKLPPTAIPLDLRFDNGLRLVGYQSDSVVNAAEPLFHPPSGWAHVTLYWSAFRPITDNPTPFVHLVGPEGVWGASLERANDALKLYPPDRWAAGAIVRHDVDVNLNPATPPGVYRLLLKLNGQETHYPLGQIEVR